jgi:hypothetical protein
LLYALRATTLRGASRSRKMKPLADRREGWAERRICGVINPQSVDSYFA